MNCKTTLKSIQDYFDGHLVALDRNEFVRHVSECASCEREVEAYRDVFSGLRTMRERERVPSGFQTPILVQLKADGLIHEPRIPVLRRLFDRFLDLPALARYPLAAGAVVAALYYPLIGLLGLIPGLAGRATVFMSDTLVAVRDAGASVGFVARFADVLGSYVRTLKTLFDAVVTLASSSGEGALLLVLGMIAIPIAVLVVSFRTRKKRSSRHATYSL